MPKSSPEQTVDFLLDFLPNLLPKPADSVAKSAIESFRGSLDGVLKEARIKRELLNAAQKAESEFRKQAQKQLKNVDLVQAIASFPLFDRDLFQSTLADLPNHLQEEYLAKDLHSFIDNDWKGKFSPENVREGVALYLNCLRVQLLAVEDFADVVTRLATLRTDQRTEQILAVVTELSQLVKLLLNKGNGFPQITTYGLFTIPTPVTDFTGREKELEQLKDSFSRGAIITGLSGAGGIGKTELARKLAHDIGKDFPDAQINIDLLGTSEKPTSPEDAMRRLLEPFHVGQKLPDEKKQLENLYQHTFRMKKVLLLLDNAENAAQVRPLIPPAPSAAIITSRQQFSLTEFGLLEPLRLDVLSSEKAREFLRGASPKLNAYSDEQINELARLCGHLPLALRVTASLLNDRPDWKLEDLLNRLGDERKRLLILKRDGDQDLDVKAAINLSYQLLSPELQRYFRMLGVFSLPFLIYAAKAIWGLEDEDTTDHIIGQLTNRSLIIYLPNKDKLGDYVLHDLTRLFAQEKLIENQSECEKTLENYSRYFFSWAHKAALEFEKGGESFSDGVNLFIYTWLHLSAVWDKLLPEQKIWSRPKFSDSWISSFAIGCVSPLMYTLKPKEQIYIFQCSVDAARRLGNKSDESFHLGNLGTAFKKVGDFQKAIEIYEYGLSLMREVGNRQSEGATLGNLGAVYSELGDIKKSIDFNLQALEIARELNNRRDERDSLGTLATVYIRLGDYKKAGELCKQSLLIDHEIGDPVGECIDLGNLGAIYLYESEIDKSVDCFEKQLEISKKINYVYGIGRALDNLAVVYGNLGQIEKAILFSEEAIRFLESVESPVVNNVREHLENFRVKEQLRKIINAAKNRSADASKYFEDTTQVIKDVNIPTEHKKLAIVLQKILVGIKNPDLSLLSEDWAQFIHEELERKAE